MSLNPLAKKLQIKSGHKLLPINAPPSLPFLLAPLSPGVQIADDAATGVDVILLFVTDSTQLKEELTSIKNIFEPCPVFWIAYPKKSSGISSDLDMMASWSEPEKYGLRPVASVKIDETWTASRFRPAADVRQSEVSNAAIRENDLGKYIDLEKRVITLPADLKSELEQSPAALNFFQSLSWTYKKEYLTWVLSAKQEKTRKDRIKKTSEKLAAGKKTPAEK